MNRHGAYRDFLARRTALGSTEPKKDTAGLESPEPRSRFSDHTTGLTSRLSPCPPGPSPCLARHQAPGVRPWQNSAPLRPCACPWAFTHPIQVRRSTTRVAIGHGSQDRSQPTKAFADRNCLVSTTGKWNYWDGLSERLPNAYAQAGGATCGESPSLADLRPKPQISVLSIKPSRPFVPTRAVARGSCRGLSVAREAPTRSLLAPLGLAT
jgi:hypothetical protein